MTKHLCGVSLVLLALGLSLGPAAEAGRWTEPTLVTPLAGTHINGPREDAGLDLSPDGLTMYFASTRPNNGTGADVPHNIWQATRASVGAPWGSPTKVPVINDPTAADGAPAIQWDGTNMKMVFHSTRPGGSGNLDLYSSSYGGWTTPQLAAPIGASSVNSLSEDAGLDLTPDKLTLYFATTRSGNQHDIWQASRPSVNDPWAAPTKVPFINHPTAADGTPAIQMDGSTMKMIFHSNRPGGSGNLDLYTTTYGGWDAPQMATPIGASNINSAYEDAGLDLSPDGLTMYFTSTRTGNHDIWQTSRTSLSDPWGTATKVPGINSASAADGTPAIHVDGSTVEMIFHSNRPGAASLDLYSSTWDGSAWGAPVSLSALNSGLNDLTPAIRHHDGTATLYFGRNVTGSNRDLYQSTYDPLTSTWGTPIATPFAANVNTAYNEMSPAVSDDGNFLYFTRNAGAPGYRLYRSAWDTAADQWGTPAPLSFPDTSSQQHTPNFDGEYEGATLYFAQADSGGDWNIYESTWTGSGWSVTTGWNTPTNLGPAFNTGLHELTPAIRHHDGTATLYFARDIGGGNRDLFQSTWNPATKTWDAPTAAPFASGVNTTAPEMSPSVSDDGDVLYFSRNAGSPGYRLYRSVWDATNSRWSTPLLMNLPVLGDQQHAPNFDGEYEGAKLLFAQYDGTGSAGSWNIYETTWTGSGWAVPTGWGEAENLGSSLNTALHDLTPSVRNHDGTSTLYFARDIGSGNRDLFMSEWDPVAEAWGAATALEFASHINTGSSEFCPTVSKDGTLLYFARNVGGYHLYRSVWDDLAGEWGAPTLLDLGDPAKQQHTPNLEAEDYGAMLYFAQYDGSSYSDGSWNIYESVYIPEPASLAIVGAGLLALCRRRRS